MLYSVLIRPKCREDLALSTCNDTFVTLPPKSANLAEVGIPFISATLVVHDPRNYTVAKCQGVSVRFD